MADKRKKKTMPVREENILVKVKVNRERYEQYKEAAAEDRRSFSQWAEIALDEKLMRTKNTPRP